MFELGNDGPSVIVAGFDGSDSSWRATAYAIGLARRQRSDLTVAYIQPPAGAGSSMYAPITADMRQEVADDLRAQLDAEIARTPQPERIPVAFHTEAGDPYHALLELAERLKADAIVIGASEKAGHRIVGSLAVRLVKAGKVPVTVVP
jgi:nucleotide-binding universal stress UspA family protein